jgi:hypothetical protein
LSPAHGGSFFKHPGIAMFLFFSNRLGWLGSILLSIALTLLLLFLFSLF